MRATLHDVDDLPLSRVCWIYRDADGAISAGVATDSSLSDTERAALRDELDAILAHALHDASGQ